MSTSIASKGIGLFLPILLLIALFGLFKAFGPLLTDIDDATVHLKDCEGEHCVLSGHLSQQAFTGHYVLTKIDGTQLIFSPDAVGIMSWPAPEK